LKLLVDEGSFIELNETIIPYDSLGFKDAKGSYLEKINTAMRKTGLKESVVTGEGKMNRKKVVLAVMDFHFLGGSLGSGTGEKIYQAAVHAVEHKLPLIVVSASGGARMQEGVLSLMQMAKTCAGIAQVNQKQLPYISVLTDPTSGGVSASYAMMGDINIAEPGALIAFAGRRVIEQTIKQKLPDDFQTAEYLLEHGFIDCIASRGEMKNKISQILDYYNRR
jgi:acetyl-CoA carboxylase carboxyl transferase subunit beta